MSVTSVLDDRALYLTDGGACYCGAHCGMTARMTGHDVSGQLVERVTATDVATARALGWDPRCEACGRTA